MINSLKPTITRNIKNIAGWRTDRKIIVIESDDWGSIRMPNKDVYNKLLKKDIRVDLCPYNKYDTLANTEDFEALFDTLRQHTDFKNNSPIITINTNVANPDFEAIQNGNFEKYIFEYFTKTLLSYYPNEDVISMWHQGIKEKYIYPQLHGREHLNPEIWLELIKRGNSPLMEAFKLKLYGLSFITSKDIKIPFLAALIYNTKEGKQSVENSLIEGSQLFQQIFGFTSKSFIAPLYTWSLELESTFSKIGVKYIQGSDRNIEYDFNLNSFKRSRHIMGSSNKYSQTYLHRNCTFEPTVFSKIDNIDECLNQIKTAFFWKKPAVISMHRLNIIGVLDEKNRTQNLKSLDILLTKIKQRWGDVEFMHSSDLGELIQKSKHHVL
jgi:hypothetical protein